MLGGGFVGQLIEGSSRAWRKEKHVHGPARLG